MKLLSKIIDNLKYCYRYCRVCTIYNSTNLPYSKVLHEKTQIKKTIIQTDLSKMSKQNGNFYNTKLENCRLIT